LGLTRRGFDDNQKSSIKKAYRYLFRSDLNQSDALNRIREEFKEESNIQDIIKFYESSKRGII
jgi:UDP-N-acetylglucosamine acyltransferase